MSLRGKKDPFPDAGKTDSKYEDNRYGGMTVSKARKEQEKHYRLKMMITQAEQSKTLGFDLTPQQQFIIDNRDLLG